MQEHSSFWKPQVIVHSRNQFQEESFVNGARKYLSGPGQKELFWVKIFNHSFYYFTSKYGIAYHFYRKIIYGIVESR